MRLDPVSPDEMNDEQRRLHEEIAPVVEENLNGFVSERDDGALVGPFAPMLRWPAWGEGVWAQARTLLEHTVLPQPAHEVAILVTGSGFGALYELYAHERVAEGIGLSAAKIATIVAGQRPVDLSAQEAVAYDLASVLVRGGPVPDPTYLAATEAFGEEGAAEVIFLVAGYCTVSVLLNGFAMSVPGDAV